MRAISEAEAEGWEQAEPGGIRAWCPAHPNGPQAAAFHEELECRCGAGAVIAGIRELYATEKIDEREMDHRLDLALGLRKGRKVGDGVKVLVPRDSFKAGPIEPGGYPSLTRYDEVWLSPHELRAVAVAKQRGADVLAALHDTSERC